MKNILYLTKNLSFKDVQKTINLPDEYCYSLIDHGFYIYQESGDWVIIGNNDFGGWKTTIPKVFIGGD